MVVADDDDAGSRPRQPPQRAGQMVNTRRIEIVGRLVEQDKIGRRLENCPQRQVVPLSTRQTVEPVIQTSDQPRRQTIAGSPGQRQQFAPAERHAFNRGDILSLQCQTQPRARLEHAGKHPRPAGERREQCRLAHPVGSGQPENPARFQREFERRRGRPLPGTAWDADCEDANRDSDGTAGLIRLALADGSWLVQATCAQGAYQGSFWAAQLWIAHPGQGVGALLRWPIAAEHLGAPASFELSEQVVVWGDLTVLAQPHSTRAELEILNRFRAPGDCGTRTRYALERGALRVVGLAAVFTCPESLGLSGPAAWPALPTSDR